MKIVLVGHPGSQKIVPASKYLTSKYLPGFDITYLNYEGEINGWADYVKAFMKFLTEPLVILALDDYLIADHIDMVRFEEAKALVDGNIMNAKLCRSTQEEHDEYPVTTQYTIWDRHFLIWLLSQPEVNTPWEFEINGSRIFKQCHEIAELQTCMNYGVHSCLSSRWEGVRFDGLKDEDLTHIKEHGLI